MRATLLGIPVAVLMLSGCAGDGFFGGYGSYYDGYYDGYYGPYGGGYWANDGFFYYIDRQRNYHRDDGRHFRHERFTGGTRFRGDNRGDERGGRRDSDNAGRDRR